MKPSFRINPELVRSRRKLTEKQKNLLFFISEYLAEHSAVPSNTKMCAFLNINSNNAGGYLKALASKGYLFREAGVGYFPTSNALQLLEDEGRRDVLDKIAIRDEEQLQLHL